MNFKRFKEITQFHVENGKKMGANDISAIIAMERCEAVKEFLDESYTSVLTDDEREFIETTIRMGMRKMITDAFLHASERPTEFNDMLSKVLGLDTDEFGGEIDEQ